MGAINPTEAAMEERRLKCWDLRVSGWTLRQIAKELGLSAATVHKHIDHVLERTKADCDERAEQHRLMSLQRLDKAIAVLMRRIEDDDDALEAMDRLDKLERRRASLLGLDAPAKQEIVAAFEGPGPELAARLVREAFGEKALPKESDVSALEPGIAAAQPIPEEPPTE